MNAGADELSPWYLSGAVGQSRYSRGDLPASIDNKDTAFNVGGGFRFLPYAALELGYTDFGTASQSFSSGSMFAPLSTTLQAKISYGALVLGAPLGDAFSIFGKLGYGSTKRNLLRVVQVIDIGTGATSTISIADSSRRSEALYSIGAAYAFTPNVSATLEWQRLDKTRVDAGMAGIRFSF